MIVQRMDCAGRCKDAGSAGGRYSILGHNGLLWRMEIGMTKVMSCFKNQWVREGRYLMSPHADDHQLHRRGQPMGLELRVPSAG